MQMGVSLFPDLNSRPHVAVAYLHALSNSEHCVVSCLQINAGTLIRSKEDACDACQYDGSPYNEGLAIP
jgi:hypothetical protein